MRPNEGEDKERRTREVCLRKIGHIEHRNRPTVCGSWNQSYLITFHAKFYLYAYIQPFRGTANFMSWCFKRPQLFEWDWHNTFLNCQENEFFDLIISFVDGQRSWTEICQIHFCSNVMRVMISYSEMADYGTTHMDLYFKTTCTFQGL